MLLNNICRIVECFIFGVMLLNNICRIVECFIFHHTSRPERTGTNRRSRCARTPDTLSKGHGSSDGPIPAVPWLSTTDMWALRLVGPTCQQLKGTVRARQGIPFPHLSTFRLLPLKSWLIQYFRQYYPNLVIFSFACIYPIQLCGNAIEKERELNDEPYVSWRL
jgi:hypothetical protein